MTRKIIPCNQCKSLNTELELEENENDEDADLYVQVWCNDCMTYTPFPHREEDWRDY